MKGLVDVEKSFAVFGSFLPFACEHVITDGVAALRLQLVEQLMIRLDWICRRANVMLIFARSYGLTGFVRISLKVMSQNLNSSSVLCLVFEIYLLFHFGTQKNFNGVTQFPPGSDLVSSKHNTFSLVPV